MIIRTQEHRNNQSIAMKRFWGNPFNRKKMEKVWKNKELRKRISDIQKKKWKNLELIKQVSENQKRFWQNPKYREKHRQIMKQNWQNPKYRERMIKSFRKYHKNPKYRKRHSKTMKEFWQNFDYRKKTIEKMRINGRREEFKEKMSNIIKRKWKIPKYRKKMITGIKNRYDVDPEYRRKIMETTTNRWKDPLYKESVLKKMIKSINMKPNKSELKLDLIIQENFPNQFKYNNGLTIINGHIPDFINCNGQKKIINFNGIYWHLWMFQKENPNLTKEIVEKRETKPYEEFGFKTLIIWEDELEEQEKLIQKIGDFTRQ